MDVVSSNDTFMNILSKVTTMKEMSKCLRLYPNSIDKYFNEYEKRIKNITDFKKYDREFTLTLISLFGIKGINKKNLILLIRECTDAQFFQTPSVNSEDYNGASYNGDNPKLSDEYRWSMSFRTFHTAADATGEQTIDNVCKAFLSMIFYSRYTSAVFRNDVIRLVDRPDCLIPEEIYREMCNIIVNTTMALEEPDEVINFVVRYVPFLEVLEEANPLNFYRKVNEKALANELELSPDMLNAITEVLVNMKECFRGESWDIKITDIGSFLCSNIENEKYLDYMRKTYSKYFGDDALVYSSDIINIFSSISNNTQAFVLNRLIAHYLYAQTEDIPIKNPDEFYHVYRCMVNDVINKSGLKNLIANNMELGRLIVGIKDSFMSLTQEKIMLFAAYDEIAQYVSEWKNDEDYEIELEASESNSKRYSLSRKVNKATNKVYGKYRDYKDKEIKVDSQLTKMVDSMRDIAIGDPKDEIIEGKKMTVLTLLKKILGTYAVYEIFGPIKTAIALTLRFALHKKRTIAERKKIVMDLDQEIDIIEEKIEDAKSDGNRKAKYNMMRTRSELIRARDRIRAGLANDPNTTQSVKSTFNTEQRERKR